MWKQLLNKGYPASLLPDVAWAFIGAPFSSRDEFENELKKYQAEIMGHSSWEPSQRVLKAAQVIIQHEEEVADGDGEGDGAEVVLTADNGDNFTAGELMFKIHNAFVEGLSDLDHHFFEGLALLETRSGIPVYQVNLGS